MQKWVIFAEYREIILIQWDFWLIKWIIWTCNYINLSKTILVFFLSKVKKTLSSVDNFFDRLLKMTLHWWMRSKKKNDYNISNNWLLIPIYIFWSISLKKANWYGINIFLSTTFRIGKLLYTQLHFDKMSLTMSPTQLFLLYSPQKEI